MDPSITSSKIDSMPSHEVPKTGESVESSSLELQTRVLPSSFHMSDIKRSQEPPMENQSRDANAHNFHAYCQNISNNEANLNETNSVHRNESDAHGPSLKETAGTHECDDSIDELQGGTSNRASRFHLPSPKRKKFSPLKKYEPANITKRRKPKKWTELEEKSLRTAVSKIGKGNWKLILNSYMDVFEGRTEVDLKDKWRNMTRYGGI